MSYRYEFDDTRDGDLRLRRTSYELLQDAYRGLRDELEAWNRRALEHGGSTPPYEQEVDDLNRMLAWGDEQLAEAGASEIAVRGISVAGSRFGVVVISPHFLDKEWPQRELDGLAAREVTGIKVILPVWHNITAEQLRARSPILADRIAALSSDGIDRVVDDLARAIAAGTTTTATG